MKLSLTRWVLFTGLQLILVLTGFAAEQWKVIGATFRPDGIYQPDEKIIFQLQVLRGNTPVAGKKIHWERQGDDGKVEQGELLSEDKPVAVTTSLDRPGFVYLKATVNEPEGNAVFEGGAGVSPEQISGHQEPADFDNFWQAQKKLLAAVPLKWTMTPVKVSEHQDKVEAFDLRVDCAGGKPVSGYFARLKNAAPHSLPAVLILPFYGVYPPKIESGFAAHGMLALCINAHGIANDKPSEYYRNLNSGELNSYGFKGNDDAEKCYLRGIILRALRALEFLKAQPEWDGRNLMVYGSSQGGFQALTVAGLDPQVSCCFALEPWLCEPYDDCKTGRMKSIFQPGAALMLDYLNPAHHARRIKCPTYLQVGLGDRVCPPAGVTAAFNNLRTAERKLVYIQGATHTYRPPDSVSIYPDLFRIIAEITAEKSPKHFGGTR